MVIKKFILILAFFIPAISVLSQDFSLSELLKINNYSIDDFDTYVTQKGYKYFENNDEDFGNSTSYTFYVDNIKTAYISKFHYKKTSKEMVSFQTGNSSTYISIKTDLKNLGFRFIGVR
jgi:hypothetical protein